MIFRTRNRYFFAISLILLLLGISVYTLKSFHDREQRLEEARKRAAEAKFEEVKVRLIEGWTNQQIISYLEKQGFSGLSALNKVALWDVKEYPFLSTAPKTATLEGFLFPDTYRIEKNAEPADINRTLLGTFNQKIVEASERVPGTADLYLPQGYGTVKLAGRSEPGISLFELITLASIIEKETGQAGESATSERLLEERQTVAGIFLNRLAIGQPLQSDATVNYVTKAGLASPTLEQTKVDSPYNTYQNAGLPPGPISNPSYSSLYAALHPIQTDYYYFLHKQPSGEVAYGRTYEEHLQNKARCLK
jgi:UPF0755 protein